MKKLFYLLPVAALILTMAACNDDNDVLHGLTAVAGPDREVTVGETVELDASASIDLNGSGFQTLWAFVSTPDGSNAAISNANSNNASFVPDIAGVYDISLTISNAEGESSDELQITAIPGGTMNLSGSYNDDLHLINLVEDPDTPDYLVTGDVNIYAALTIDAGVRIHVSNDKMIRIRNDGSLEANGTSAEPIVITGETEVPGYWKGIMHESNNVVNVMSHVNISATGSSDISSGRPKTAFYVASGRISLQNSVFSNNDGFGVTIWSSDAEIPLLGCFFENNTLGAMSILAEHMDGIDDLSNFNGQEVLVRGGSLAAGSEHTWVNPTNGIFRVAGEINAYGRLEILEGVEFRMENNVRFRVRSEGVIQVMGTETNPVVFKGATELAGAWRGVYIESNSIENQFNHVSFSHAGHEDIAPGFGKTAIGFASGARAMLSNIYFSDIDGYGTYIRYDNTNVTFSALNFGPGLTEAAIFMRTEQISALDHESDFGNYYVVVDGGTLNKGTEHQWIKLQNGKYFFVSEADIYDKIIIEAGSIFEFDNDVRFRLRASGTLIAQGTSSDMIVFTRRAGSGSYWKGIYYQSNSVESIMDYVDISYAGNTDLAPGISQSNIGIDSGARLTLTNSIISNSLGWGIDVRSGGELMESNNSFFDNASGDINYQ